MTYKAADNRREKPTKYNAGSTARNGQSQRRAGGFGSLLCAALYAVFLTLGTILPASVAAHAHSQFLENATIYLRNNSGEELAIGELQIGASVNGESGFTISINNDAFSEHFLSMRPFRCLQGETEWFCYLPYPYDLRNTISKDDLSDLEYQLLFLRKTAKEFGIDAWNGLYYKLTLNEDRSIEGSLLEGDLNSLQSPPAEKYSKPVELNEFIEANSDKRLFPSLIIR